MKKPLLSICIPTYNRCQYLRNSMNSIICQKEFREGWVEIVISDNASTDGTESMVQEYALRYKNIHYFRNNKNLHDENFPLALSRGTGVYRKLSTDLFLYLPHSLGYICKVVKKYRGTETLLCWLDGKGKHTEDERIGCTSFDEIVFNVRRFAVWVGTFGLWDSECKMVTSDISGSEKKIWQCEHLYKMASDKGTALLINRRLFFVQEVNKKNMSYGLYQVLHLNFLSILNDYVDKGFLSHETYNAVREDSLYLLMTFFTRGRHNNKKWNFPDEESTKERVIIEVKQIGAWDKFQRSYKIYRLFYPIRISIKCAIQNAFSIFLEFKLKMDER